MAVFLAGLYNIKYSVYLVQALTQCLTNPISITKFHEFVIQDPMTESSLILMICLFYGNT